jgi:serine/threonine protein kinase
MELTIGKKLGGGAFSEVFLVCDKNIQMAMKVSLKKNKRAQSYARKEVNILQKLMKSESKYSIKMYGYHIDDARIEIYLEYMGMSLYDVIKHYRYAHALIPPNWIWRINDQMVNGLRELETIDVLHNDLKPENILLENFEVNHIIFRMKYCDWVFKYQFISGEKDRRKIKKRWEVCSELLLRHANIKICDFGNAVSLEIKKKFPTWKDNTIATRHYRAPECVAGYDYWIKADIWSVACIIMELFLKDQLFFPYRNGNMSTNSRHLLDIILIFGNGMATDNKYFTNGKHKYQYLTRYLQETCLFKEIIEYGYSSSVAAYAEQRLLHMFSTDPKKRKMDTLR